MSVTGVPVLIVSKLIQAVRQRFSSLLTTESGSHSPLVKIIRGDLHTDHTINTQHAGSLMRCVDQALLAS